MNIEDRNPSNPAAVVIQQAKQRLRLLARTVHLGNVVGARPEEHLTFEDLHLTGVEYLNSANKHGLDLIHTILPPGTLLRLRLEDPRGVTPPWCRFVVLRPGSPHVIGKLLIEEALPPGVSSRHLVVEIHASAATVKAEQAVDLLTDYRQAQELDPKSVPFWQEMASRTLLMPHVPEAVRRICQEIADG